MAYVRKSHPVRKLAATVWRRSCPRLQKGPGLKLKLRRKAWALWFWEQIVMKGAGQ